MFVQDELYQIDNILFKGIPGILFGRRGPPTLRNCARQGKKFDISIFFYFFLRHARKTKNFFSKCAQIMWNLTIFLTKINFSPYFLFFPPTLAKRQIIYFFFPPTEQKKPCRTSSTKQFTADALSNNNGPVCLYVFYQTAMYIKA